MLFWKEQVWLAYRTTSSSFRNTDLNILGDETVREQTARKGKAATLRLKMEQAGRRDVQG